MNELRHWLTAASFCACALSFSLAHAGIAEDVQPLVVECHPVYDLDNVAEDESLCGTEAVLLGTRPDLNNSGFVAFTDDIVRYLKLGACRIDRRSHQSP